MIPYHHLCIVPTNAMKGAAKMTCAHALPAPITWYMIQPSTRNAGTGASSDDARVVVSQESMDAKVERVTVMPRAP